MGSQTAQHGLRFPEPGDSPDVPGDTERLALDVDGVLKSEGDDEVSRIESDAADFDTDFLFPESKYDDDTTTIQNHNSLGYFPTGNAPEFTFVASKSGNGNIRMFVKADSDFQDERFSADVEIREDNSGGAVVHSPEDSSGGIRVYYEVVDKPSVESFYGDRPLGPLGLTPGATYWAQLQIDTQGTDIDLFAQWIMYEPYP